MLARPQEDDADLFGVDVENEPLHILGKEDDLLRPDVGQAADPHDAVTDIVDEAHLPLRELRMLVREDRVHRFERIVEKILQFFLFVPAWSCQSPS